MSIFTDDMEKVADENDDEEEESISRLKLRSPSIFLFDYRMKWIRDRVIKFLGLTGQGHLFDGLMSANNRYFEDKLLNFLILDLYGVTSLEKKLIFFYKTYVSEVVQEEVSVWEESQRVKITALTAFTSKSRTHRLTKSAPGKVEKFDDDVKRMDKKSAKRSKKDKVKGSKADFSPASSLAMSSSTLQASSVQVSGDDDAKEDDNDDKEHDGSGEPFKKEEPKSAPADSSDFVPPPGEEDKYVLTKKMVEKVRKVPVVHMICGEIDGSRTDLCDVTLFYFMRTNDDGIPSFDTYEECLDDITSYLVVGSFDSRYLASLNRILTDVFKPLVEKQFRGPDFYERWKAEKEVEGPIVEKSISALETMESRSAALRRPSEFRRASVMITPDLSAIMNRQNEDDDLISAVSLQDEARPAKSKRSKASLRGSSRKSLLDLKSSISTDTYKETLRDQQNKKDVLNYLDSLIESVEWTLEHVEGDILLAVPTIAELQDPAVTDDMLLKNKDIVQQMEDLVMSWEKHIQKVIESYASKVLPEKGPMVDCEYWQACETGLTMLVEQLKMPVMKRIPALLEQARSPIAPSFQYYHTELWKQYVEARDSNKFMQTLLRYFKLITDSDSFESIAECMPALTESLRMLWVLSSYYSSEERMMQLMSRISWQLCQNVRKNLAIVTLFKRPLEVVLGNTSWASMMMRQWKRSYLKTRSDIELLGKGIRWEFDQKRLFEATEYIADVCSDLHKIASVLQDFYNIFGADLKSIIDDPAQIDTVVKRVDALMVPIEQADFDVFNVFNREDWQAMTAWFYEEVSFLEDQAKFYIDECFNALINAEGALEMLLKFKNTKTRAAIRQLLLRKFDVVMQQFSKEIITVENIYHWGKRQPPLLTYHPPVAGAIFWVRQLFHRLHRPVLIFQQVSELKQSELKLVAFSQYLDIANQLKDFEESKFNAWIDNALLTITATMRKSVLKIVHVERDSPATLTFPEEQQPTKELQLIHLASKTKQKDMASVLSTPRGSLLKQNTVISKPSVETSNSEVVGSRVVAAQTRPETNLEVKVPHKEQKAFPMSLDKQDVRAKISWSEFMSGTILVECQLRFQLNFDLEVFEIIREAELMEQLGYELPAALRDVGVQKNRLRADIAVTEKIVNEYNSVVDALEKCDVQLLKRTLQDIERHLQPGVTRFNWNSLSISDYAFSCGKMLKNLNSIVDQVNQMKRDLDSRIESELQSYHLFSTRKEIDERDLLPCKLYFLEIKNRRSELVSLMSKAYVSISPMLMKLESLVLGTSTGKSPDMQLLYEKYEKKIFVAFIMCMVRNMEVLNKMLSKNKPIFQIDAVLMASEVVLRPSPSEMYSIICQDVRDLLERLKGFSRWMNGTCLMCEPQKKELSEELITFSFFEDVLSVRVVNELVKLVQDTAYKLSMDCWRYLYRWKKYSNLWSFDKNLVCEKFAATKPTLPQYDEKFTFYESILEEVEDMELHFNLSSIRINLKPLLSGIERHAKEWKQTLGNYLISDTVQAMSQLKTRIENFQTEIQLVITGLDRYTIVMQTIADVKKVAVQTEVQFLSYQECFQTMRSHGIEFSPADEATAHKLQQDWEALYLEALYRASTLESTSDKFCEMTEDQINRLLDEIAEFAEDFEARGPGSVGDNLELGLKKMEEYGKLIDKYEEKRATLAKSEMLFDLPPVDYSAFLKVKKDYENMAILYDLYKQQRGEREIWAKTLWVDLNPQQLIDGMEHYMREFRKLPKPIKTMNVGHALDANMRNFRNSVPLFIELKNEAMRDRHWEELMKRTGRYFDMDPDRCASDTDS